MSKIIRAGELHCMIDIETLGTRPGCVILQIGAVKFNSERILEDFKVGISLEDSICYDLVTEADTLGWWDTQDQDLYKEVAGGKEGLVYALYALNDFVGTNSVCWSKWSHFDFPILQAAYDKIDIEFNISYRNRRCYATVAKLAPQVDYIAPIKAHDALEDARAQALHFIDINKKFIGVL